MEEGMKIYQMQFIATKNENLSFQSILNEAQKLFK